LKIRKAVIPAAGLGTRFLPATKAQPKEMLPIVDKPTIQYIVEEAVQSGIEDIVIITGRGKTAIEDHFDKSYELESVLDVKDKKQLLLQVEGISNLASIYYVRQKEPLGLGHAIWCARSFIGEEPFAVLLGDDIVVSRTPCLQQMIEVYDREKSALIGVRKVEKNETDKYGIIWPESIKSENLIEVKDLIEKPSIEKAPSNLAIMGRYILPPKIFDIIEKITPGHGGEIQLTDALRILKMSQRILAYEFEGTCYDVGDKFGYIKATLEIALRRDDLHKKVKTYLGDLAQRGFELE